MASFSTREPISTPTKPSQPLTNLTRVSIRLFTISPQTLTRLLEMVTNSPGVILEECHLKRQAELPESKPYSSQREGDEELVEIQLDEEDEDLAPLINGQSSIGNNQPEPTG